MPGAAGATGFPRRPGAGPLQGTEQTAGRSIVGRLPRGGWFPGFGQFGHASGRAPAPSSGPAGRDPLGPEGLLGPARDDALEALISGRTIFLFGIARETQPLPGV